MNSIDKKLDEISPVHTKLKYTDENGNGRCYTCGKKGDRFTLQNGHYIPRGNTQYRWDENNLRLQCEKCNCELGGNLEAYRDMLVHELGSKTVALMEFNSKRPHKWFKSDKKDLLAKLRKEVKEMLKDKNFQVKI